jgi:hypothetical protein
MRLPSPSTLDIYNELGTLLKEPSTLTGLDNFLDAGSSNLEFYVNRFEECLDILHPGWRKPDDVGQTRLNSKHLMPPDNYVYPDEVRQKLKTALGMHAACTRLVPESDHQNNKYSHHPTRLCLSVEGRSANQLVQFEFALAPMDFNFWQDFSVSVDM